MSPDCVVVVTKLSITAATAPVSALAHRPRPAESAAVRYRTERPRLDARTHEADVAKSQVASARADSAEQKPAADRARGEADAANVTAGNSAQQSAELQRQIDALQAKATDRGLVLTLGDMLFATGKASIPDAFPQPARVRRIRSRAMIRRPADRRIGVSKSSSTIQHLR